jgi:hypothetical protein
MITATWMIIAMVVMLIPIIMPVRRIRHRCARGE